MLVSEPAAPRSFLERLPEDKPGLTPPASFTALVVGLAVFLVAINLGARVYLDNYTPNLGLWLVRQKWELLLHLKESQDVLILGDSAANQGLVPEVIQEETGLRSVNLATVGNLTLLNDIWMLKEYLQRFDPPRVILIMNTYQTWHRYPNLQAVNTIPFFGISDRGAVFEPIPNISLMDRLGQFALHYMPLYSESQSMRTVLRAILQFPPDLSHVIINQYSLSHLGTYAVYRQDKRELGQDIERHLGTLQGVSFISDENIQALTELKRIAENYDFQIYLINAPIVNQVANSPDFPGYFRPIADYLKDFASGTVNVHYVSEVFSYPRKAMQSADHLLSEAALDFTHQIVALIFK